MKRKPSYYEELVGKHQGNITVIRIEKTVPKKGNLWLCRCDCGAEFLASTSAIKSGRKYCAKCAREYTRQRSKKQLTKHGMHGTKLHGVWWAMISRCYCEGDTNFEYYGERGIAVCEEWRNDFQAFYDWAITNGYSEELTIDRKDTNGNYCPENCRWATKAEQSRNRRSNIWITIDGVRMVQQDWARIIGVSHTAIIQAEKHGISKEDYIRRKLKNKGVNASDLD